MFALALAAAIVAGPSQVITNEPRIKYLEGEIARTKAHLAKLEKQLAQLKPPAKPKDKPAPRAKLKFDSLLAALTILCVMFVAMLLICSGCALVVLR